MEEHTLAEHLAGASDNSNLRRIDAPGAPASRYFRRRWYELLDGGSDEWVYATWEHWLPPKSAVNYSSDGPPVDGRRKGVDVVFISISDVTETDLGVHWAAAVSLVSLGCIPCPEIEQAMKSCGSDIPQDEWTKGMNSLWVANACREYGLCAIVWDKLGRPVKDKYARLDESCRTFRSLRNQAANYVRQNLYTRLQRNECLGTHVVNRVGMTAYEAHQGTGGLWSALRRIKQKGGTPEQALALQMYQNAGSTLGAGQVPEDIRRK